MRYLAFDIGSTFLKGGVLDLDEADWTNLSATALEEKFARDAAGRRASQGQSQTRIPPGVSSMKSVRSNFAVVTGTVKGSVVAPANDGTVLPFGSRTKAIWKIGWWLRSREGWRCSTIFSKGTS